MEYLRYVLYFLVFPGFLFTAVCGMLTSYIDRKVTARVHWRKGPPVLQPFYDFFKLMGKETIIPGQASRAVFLVSPLVALSVLPLVSTLLFMAMYDKNVSFVGDIIVAIYLLSIPSVCIIMGGFASGNPIASVGASREMKMILSYELPFILSILVPVIKSGSLKIGAIMQSAPAIYSVSGFLAFLVAVICMQAKLGLVPFDAAEAEQEIIAGPFIEYSGPPLAIFRLTKQMMLFVLPVFLMSIFMPAGSFLGFFIKYFALVVLIILIRNTNPRLRIDQAVRFFWTKLSVVAVIAVLFALAGL